MTGTGLIYIPAAGTYTFDVNSDDGFSLTIGGANFISGTNTTSLTSTSFAYDAGRGEADTLGVANFAAAGYYPISLLFFQGTGPSGVEVSAATGSQSAFSSTLFHLIGDTADGGLAMGGTYAPAPFSVTVDPLATNDSTPALSGTTSSPSADLTVRIGGVYYAVANNNGAWTLPEGAIVSPLPDGTYNVLASASDSTGQAAFDATSGELSIGSNGPTVSIAPIVPPTLSTGLSSLAIHYSEPVSGFGVQNLQLTFDGLSAPLGGATLTTSNNQDWTLGNLAGLDAADGSYQLIVSPQGYAVTDNFGAPLTSGTSVAWAVNVSAPQVTAVYVNGSAWQQSFLDYLGTSGLGRRNGAIAFPAAPISSARSPGPTSISSRCSSAKT